MTTIGFIGLGIMGSPMARNLVEAGFDVVRSNLHEAAVQRLVEAGGRGVRRFGGHPGFGDEQVVSLAGG